MILFFWLHHYYILTLTVNLFYKKIFYSVFCSVNTWIHKTILLSVFFSFTRPDERSLTIENNCYRYCFKNKQAESVGKSPCTFTEALITTCVLNICSAIKDSQMELRRVTATPGVHYLKISRAEDLVWLEKYH